jgi:23S rRNA (pseudouridine1915-N3)-methyltransferase
MRIIIRVIGKERSKEINSLTAEYLKRTKWPIEIQELELNKSVSQEEQKILEGKLLLDKLPKSAYLCVLDEEGKQVSSKEFSGFLKDKFSNYKSVLFIIGGAFGLSEEIKKRANSKLSLGEMTYPHKLVRLMLIEQLYRAYSIVNNLPYHK